MRKSKRAVNIEIFEDTRKWYETNPELKKLVKHARENTRVFKADEYPEYMQQTQYEETVIRVTQNRSFEAAIKLHKQYTDDVIAIHNFASATNPGGGVTRGSSAQEECLCRCSTLYPILNDSILWGEYYGLHRKNRDARYTDTCIYTKDVMIIKTDEDVPQRLSEDEWIKVDVITCPAPNLRERPSNVMNPYAGDRVIVSDEELKKIHKKRARHMLSIAAAKQADILVLGAFGCGAFANDPKVVATAYKEILSEFSGVFKLIEFAIYTSPKDKRNYEVFKEILG